MDHPIQGPSKNLESQLLTSCLLELEPNNYSPYGVGSCLDSQDLLAYCLPQHRIL